MIWLTSGHRAKRPVFNFVMKIRIIKQLTVLYLQKMELYLLSIRLQEPDIMIYRKEQ